MLRFQDIDERGEFVFRFREFLERFHVTSNVHGTLGEKMILKSAKTICMRNQELDLFLKMINAQVSDLL